MTQGGDEEGCRIPQSALLRVLQGVGVATKTPTESLLPISQLISTCDVEASRLDTKSRFETNISEFVREKKTDVLLSLYQWHQLLLKDLTEERSRQIAILTLAVAYVRQYSREYHDVPIPSQVTEVLWEAIHGALTNPLLDPPLCNAVRSAQGFLSVALCSLIENGNIDELFRFHVWLPDGKRGNKNLAVHSHQPFAQSWILAGEATDCRYDVEPASEVNIGTHAEYRLAWSDGKTLSSTYTVHQTMSVIANTGVLVHAKPSESAMHTRDMTYSVPSASFHTTSVPGNGLHATLFFFDSQRGFEKNAGVLGPIDGETFAQQRDPAGVTAAQLADIVQVVRSCELSIEHGRNLAREEKLEEAITSLSNALQLCSSFESFPDPARYKALALTELTNIERQLLMIRELKGNGTKPITSVPVDASDPH